MLKCGDKINVKCHSGKMLAHLDVVFGGGSLKGGREANCVTCTSLVKKILIASNKLMRTIPYKREKCCNMRYGGYTLRPCKVENDWKKEWRNQKGGKSSSW